MCRLFIFGYRRRDIMVGKRRRITRIIMIERPDHLGIIRLRSQGFIEVGLFIGIVPIQIIPAFGDNLLGRFVGYVVIIRSLISRNADLAAICFYLRRFQGIILGNGGSIEGGTCFQRQRRPLRGTCGILCMFGLQVIPGNVFAFGDDIIVKLRLRRTGILQRRDIHTR